MLKKRFEPVGCGRKHDVVVFDAFENLGLAEVDVGNRRRSHILRASRAEASDEWGGQFADAVQEGQLGEEMTEKSLSLNLALTLCSELGVERAVNDLLVVRLVDLATFGNVIELVRVRESDAFEQAQRLVLGIDGTLRRNLRHI